DVSDMIFLLETNYSGESALCLTKLSISPTTMEKQRRGYFSLNQAVECCYLQTGMSRTVST
uniref:Uncharacterized protein n=1 Tax=Trichobilharzia regenti TaxID=157069 RepID=A0AA85KJ29_TRIRE